jgi:hypothetical protein
MACGAVKSSEEPKLTSPGWDEATTQDLVNLQAKLLFAAKMALWWWSNSDLLPVVLWLSIPY